jgi:hypothetical protein
MTLKRLLKIIYNKLDYFTLFLELLIFEDVSKASHFKTLGPNLLSKHPINLHKSNYSNDPQFLFYLKHLSVQYRLSNLRFLLYKYNYKTFILTFIII